MPLHAALVSINGAGPAPDGAGRCLTAAEVDPTRRDAGTELLFVAKRRSA